MSKWQLIYLSTTDFEFVWQQLIQTAYYFPLFIKIHCFDTFALFLDTQNYLKNIVDLTQLKTKLQDKSADVFKDLDTFEEIPE